MELLGAARQSVVQSVAEVLAPLLDHEPDSRRRPCVVLIGGCSRSGKTWLAERLHSGLRDSGVPVSIVSLDAWLIGADQRPPSTTVLQRFECAGIVRAISSLLRGDAISPPTYDPVTRRRVSERAPATLRARSGFLLVDGVIALALPELRDLASLGVFVTVSDQVRLQRLRHFYREVKGLGDEAERIIAGRENEEVPFIMHTQQWADLTFQTRCLQ